MNILTFGDFYRIKYDRHVELLAGFFLIISYFGWIAAQLVAMGIILNVVFGTSLLAGVLISLTIMLIYTYIGGMWSISITDSIQTIVIISGLLFLMIELLSKTGGFVMMLQKTPDHFFQILPEANPKAITYYVAAWITIGLGSIPQQDVFQRVMSAKSEKVTVQASYMGGFFYLTVAFIPLFIGLISKLNYPELSGGDQQMVLPMAALQHSNIFVQIIFFGALLSAILSTSSGATLAPATILAENIIRPFFPKLTDKNFLRLLRRSVVIIAAISTIMATMRSNIYELVGESSALSLVSLFVPMVAGLYSKRTTKTGALAAMILGMLTWLTFEFSSLDVPSLMPALGMSFVGMIVGSFLSNKRILTFRANE